MARSERDVGRIVGSELKSQPCANQASDFVGRVVDFNESNESGDIA